MADDLTELTIPDTMHVDNAEVYDGRDGGANESPDEHERQPSERDRMMAEISRRRSEAIDRELKHGENMADEAREAAGREALVHEDRRPKDAGDDDEDAQPAKPRRGEESEKPVQKRPNIRTVEIDGQSFNVTDDQYEELAKAGARFNLSRNQQQQQQNYQNPQTQQAKPAAQPQQTAQQRRILSKQDSEAVADRLLYGGREQVAETVEALAQHIHQQTRQEQVNQEAITAEATRRAMEYTQVNNDLQTISGEYPELWADRILGELAAVQLTHIRAEDQATGTIRSNLDSYREACNRTLDALGKQRPRSTGTTSSATQAVMPGRSTPPTGDRSAVLERKRVAKTEPSAIDRRASAGMTPRPQSGSDIVAAMRKARHQMSYS